MGPRVLGIVVVLVAASVSGCTRDPKRAFVEKLHLADVTEKGPNCSNDLMVYGEKQAPCAQVDLCRFGEHLGGVVCCDEGSGACKVEFRLK